MHPSFPLLIAVTVHTFCTRPTMASPPALNSNPGQQATWAASFFRPGTPRACVHEALQADFPLRRLSALPGIGWDNLRNVAGGQVVSFNYSNCRTTEDGRYLTPDAVFTLPVKTSVVETLAEMFETSTDITSSTARSINLQAGLSYDAASVSGSYSQEHSRVKSSQVRDDAVATRIQLRYYRYEVKLQPGSPLHPNFKSRLLSIAADIDGNLTQMARHRSQMLVRHYGTHVLTSLTTGAGLSKTDFLHRSYVQAHADSKRDIKASASASFASSFNFDASYKKSSSSATDSTYEKNMTDSYTSTFGGPILRPHNMSIGDWVKGIDTNMVAMDRAGEPLSFLITEELLPELPTPLRDELENYVMEAIEMYYEMNTVRGCTKRGFPDYSPTANVDDGSCRGGKINATLGGLYQTCTVSGKFLSSNPCQGLNGVNHVTNEHSCPSGHVAIKLATGTKLGKRESSKKCKRCGFLWLKHCCHYNYFQAKGLYETFWCASTKQDPNYADVLFGGIYSPVSTNLVTGTKGCPPHFRPQRILQEHYACLGDKSQADEAHSVPFGGFVSCLNGNPLADEQEGDGGKQEFKSEVTWPQRCPIGFNQHLVTFDDGCAIRYCIKTSSLQAPVNPPIRRPPFSSKPEAIKEEDVYLILGNQNSFSSGSQKVNQQTFHTALTSNHSRTLADDEFYNTPRAMKSTSSPADGCSSLSSANVVIAVLYVLLYGDESRTIATDTEGKLQSFENKCYR